MTLMGDAGEDALETGPSRSVDLCNMRKSSVLMAKMVSPESWGREPGGSSATLAVSCHHRSPSAVTQQIADKARRPAIGRLSPELSGVPTKALSPLQPVFFPWLSIHNGPTHYRNSLPTFEHLRSVCWHGDVGCKDGPATEEEADGNALQL